MVYIYSNHMGDGLHVTEVELDYEDLYCDECGDSDALEFVSDDIWAVREWARSQLNVFGLGGYSSEYLEEIVAQCKTILEEEEE